MGMDKRVESGGEGQWVPPDAPLKRVEREKERKGSGRVCVFILSLSGLTFEQHDTTNHFPLCVCVEKEGVS